MSSLRALCAAGMQDTSMSLNSVRTSGLMFPALCYAEVPTWLTQFIHKRPLVLLGKKKKAKAPFSFTRYLDSLIHLFIH